MTRTFISGSLSVLASLCVLQATAQTVKYYDRYGNPTVSKQSRASYKVFTPSETDPAMINVKEINVYTKMYNTGLVNKTDSLPTGVYSYYDKDQQLIKTVTYVNGLKDGACTEYQDGKKVAEYMFKEGFIQQPVTEYYPSGAVKAKKQYLTGTEQIKSIIAKDSAATNYLLRNYGAEDIDTETRMRNIDGLWDGVCTYYYESGKVASEEHFKAGKLEKAVLYDEQGTQGKTEKNPWNLDKGPVYKGDYIAFISNTLLYPKKALETQTSGTVVIGFLVAADGTVSDMKVLKSVTPEMDAEAMRVMQKTVRKWSPASYHNIPVAQYYLAPIIYNLQPNNNYMLR